VNLITRFLFLTSICFSFALAEDAESQPDSSQLTTLKVKIANLNVNQGGQLIVSLYSGEQEWLEKDLELRKIVRPISSDMNLIFEFQGLKLSNSYAVQVIHDKNENGKMDFQWLPPKPAEGTGVSNNVVRMGPPDYESARINLSQELTTLTIAMVY